MEVIQSQVQVVDWGGDWEMDSKGLRPFLFSTDCLTGGSCWVWGGMGW